ncbi:MAG: anti-virulence regulator CigR family protein [Steroidobacteraceae bacterium]|nr:anti-virulence regulator CigR family protein [Steroidobacteraceae bacterium]
MASILACLLVSGAATADGWVVFSKDETAVIQQYYAQNPVAVGKGGKNGQKGKPLPPGIARNLARGKPLPPGIAKQQLPQDLVRQLPPVHTGYERVYVDGRVLLVDIATQVIHDVLMEAVYN